MHAAVSFRALQSTVVKPRTTLPQSWRCSSFAAHLCRIACGQQSAILPAYRAASKRVELCPNRLESELSLRKSTRRASAAAAADREVRVPETNATKQLTTRERVALSHIGAQNFDLGRWRKQDIDRRWHWGNEGEHEQADLPGSSCALSGSLAECAVQVLNTAAPEEKIALTHAAWQRYVQTGLPLGSAAPPDEPARPDRPKRVPAKQVPKPKDSGLPLSVYMLLNLAHVELNAIDLAWDTVARFAQAGLPQEFYTDFAHVADDESRHLGWCLQRLGELGFSYGDMPAHNKLWEGAQSSADEVMARLVVVPCSQEARGLDAGPRLVERLMSIPDHRSAAIVDKISQEELAHVAVGSFWFQSICKALGQASEDSFRRWLAALCPELASGQFNHLARERAGLQQSWYDGQLWPEGLLGCSKGSLAVPQGLGDMDEQQLDGLKMRLVQLLDMEAAMP